MRLIVIGSVVLSVAAAFVGGFLVGRSRVEGRSTQETVEIPEVGGTRVARRLPRVAGLVCLRPGRDQDGEREAGLLRPALEWCESQLDQCEARGAFRRKDWPEATPVEFPDEWPGAVQAALEECGIGIDFDLVECTEYPCVAAFRPPVDADPAAEGLFAEPYTEYRKQLEKKLGACGPLLTAFGAGPDIAIDGMVGVYPYDAPCEGGNEPMMVLSVLHPEGYARDAVGAEDESGVIDEIRWMFRRAEDVAASWQCGAE